MRIAGGGCFQPLAGIRHRIGEHGVLGLTVSPSALRDSGEYAVRARTECQFRRNGTTMIVLRLCPGINGTAH